MHHNVYYQSKIINFNYLQSINFLNLTFAKYL